MKKEQEGIVLELNNDIAKIKVARHGSCENCGACPGDKAMVLDVNNKLGAKKGDRVEFAAPTNNMVMATFVVYMLPLISIFFGVGIGYVTSNSFGISENISEIFFAVLMFLLSLILVLYYEKRSKSSIKKLSKITKIL